MTYGKNLTTTDDVIEIVEVRRKSIGGFVAAALAGLICFGLVGASAATLGDLKVGSLGASTEKVVSCDSDGLSIRWNQNLNGNDGYVTDTVIVEDINERCIGMTIRAGVLTSDGEVLSESQATVEGTGMKLEVESIPSSKIYQVAVTISE